MLSVKLAILKLANVIIISALAVSICYRANLISPKASAINAQASTVTPVVETMYVKTLFSVQ